MCACVGVTHTCCLLFVVGLFLGDGGWGGPKGLCAAIYDNILVGIGCVL